MNWKSEYMRKLRTPEEAILENIESGDQVFIGGTTVPTTSLNALFPLVQSGQRSGITLYVVSACNPGLKLNEYTFTQEQLLVKAFFMTGPDRSYMADGKLAYLPVQFGMYNRCISAVEPDVCLVVMSPPDEEGYCNIGPYGFTCGPLTRCKKIIAQVSTTIPRVYGTSHRYHVSQIDAFVEANEQLAIVNNPPPTEDEAKIAHHILNYIEDGYCIQLGFGGIANAIGYHLKDRRHLGIHTEVLTESIIDLMECGAVDNSRKQYMPGKTAVGFVLGSQRQYDYINENPAFMFGSFGEIVNIEHIASIDHMVSINGAVSVDLTGQVCAESIGRRQYSGTGGQLDFVRGASMSKGGFSFIALPSTVHTKEGRKSRIVLDLAQGSIVTTPRTDVQWIATEFGCVNLQFKSIPERTKAMLSIAHPDYRDVLAYEARQAGLLY